MVIGIGTDLTSISRIQDSLNKFGDKFVNKIFSSDEQAYASKSKANPANAYAKLYAAKEACLKALGTGLAQNMRWEYIEVKHLPSGQPYITLSGEALKLIESKTPEGYQPCVHLSLSDEDNYAQAFVVISVSLDGSNR